MPIYVNPKFISSEMTTDLELTEASSADRNRQNHTGTQLASTISDFTSAVQSVTIDASKIDGGVVSNAEFATLDGINTGSTIQSQLNDKQEIIVGAASSVTLLDLNASKVLISDTNGKISSSSVTSTTLEFLDVASSIQSQIDGKQPTGNYITALTGDITASGPGSAVATLSATGVVAGTYDKVTVDSKGRITSASINKWTYKTTATQSTTAAAYNAVTELTSVSLPVGFYKFSAYILAQSAATTTGIGFRIGAGTATISTISSKSFISQAADGTAKNFQVDQLAANTNVPSTAVLTANSTFPSLIEGIFRITVAGTVRIEFRTEVANSAVTIQSDSMFMIELV